VIIDLLVIRPSLHPKALTPPSTFEVLQVREHTSIPSFVIFTLGLAIESIKKCGVR